MKDIWSTPSHGNLFTKPEGKGIGNKVLRETSTVLLLLIHNEKLSQTYHQHTQQILRYLWATRLSIWGLPGTSVLEWKLLSFVPSGRTCGQLRGHGQLVVHGSSGNIDGKKFDLWDYYKSWQNYRTPHLSFPQTTFTEFIESWRSPKEVWLTVRLHDW